MTAHIIDGTKRFAERRAQIAAGRRVTNLALMRREPWSPTRDYSRYDGVSWDMEPGA